MTLHLYPTIPGLNLFNYTHVNLTVDDVSEGMGLCRFFILNQVVF